MELCAGDDIVDGGDGATAGYLASVTNGGANEPSATTYTHFVSTTDTIDVKFIASSNDVTSGVLRVYAVCCDLNGVADTATEVDRDQLA